MSKNLEYIKDGKTEYCFAGNFEMLDKLECKGHDLSNIYTDLNTGKISLSTIVDILCASLYQVDKAEVNETSKEDIAKSIIERHGLQEAAMICQLMMTYAMVGSIKKSQINKDEIITGMMDQIIGSELMSLKNRGLLWMAHWVSSAVAACLIIRFSSLLT